MANIDALIQQTHDALEAADYVLVGAGAGFSAAAGLTYSGKRFEENFQPFIEKYGLSDMYSAAFYPYPGAREKWAYWARHAWINRYAPPALPLYTMLYQWLAGKHHFILTTNVDGQFAKAGFAAENIFAVQGDYGERQCARACHDQVYDNEALFAEMLAQTRDCRIPAALVPYCPRCGGDMAMHLRVDAHFVQTEPWYAQQRAYQAFADAALRGKTVYLELGVGYNTPGIIRYPFENMTYHNPQATLIRINRDHGQGMAENAEKTLTLAADAATIFTQLLEKQT